MGARSATAPPEVFARFLRLGLSSFGGPIAHLGYFRTEFVERARWFDDATFAEIVALCSVLPGPTSSQVGIVVGGLRAGWLGALCAWLGFTLPSAVALTVLGIAVRAWGSTAWPAGTMWGEVFAGAAAGLGAAAAGVVAYAVVTLGVRLWRSAGTIAIGLAALAIALVANHFSPQFLWLPLVAGGFAGVAFLHGDRPLPVAGLAQAIPRWVGMSAAAVLAGLLMILPLLAPKDSPASLFAVFFRAGSLVFGGGHVVLALLGGLIGPNSVPAPAFFAGYGAAQAVPGPLFTFASYLGAVNETRMHGVAGAALATVAIFMPSFLLLAAALPLWSALRAVPRAPAALAGINASVVGLLGAILIDPIAGTLAGTPLRVALAAATFIALTVRAAPWVVVLACALLGALAATAHLL